MGGGRVSGGDRLAWLADASWETISFRAPGRILRGRTAEAGYIGGAYARHVVSRAVPVLYSTDVDRAARFWEQVGFERRFQLPEEGVPSFVSLQSGAAEIAVTHASWAADRYGMTMGTGPESRCTYTSRSSRPRSTDCVSQA